MTDTTTSVPRYPRQHPTVPGGWDHATQCHRDRETAELVRDHRRDGVPPRADGRVTRWRVRPCHRCGGWYVKTELRKEVPDATA